MRRRSKFGLVVLVLAAIVGIAGFAAMRIANRFMGAIQEGLGIATQEMGRLGENASDPKLPKVEMHQSFAVDGDITTLTIRYQNQTRGMVIDLVLNKASLGKRVPKDKLDFPIRIGQLAPGATHEITLHYENVPWKRLDDGSAEVTIVYDEQWTGIIKGGPRKMEVRGIKVDLQLDDAKESQHTTTEGPVRLDPAGARTLGRSRETGPQRNPNEGREKGSDTTSAP
jgi:hypothetical protein